MPYNCSYEWTVQYRTGHDENNRKNWEMLQAGLKPASVWMSTDFCCIAYIFGSCVINHFGFYSFLRVRLNTFLFYLKSIICIEMHCRSEIWRGRCNTYKDRIWPGSICLNDEAPRYVRDCESGRRFQLRTSSLDCADKSLHLLPYFFLYRCPRCIRQCFHDACVMQLHTPTLYIAPTNKYTHTPFIHPHIDVI